MGLEFPNLSSETVILTPGMTVSRLVAAQYADAQVRTQRRAWESPNILSYSAWIRGVWQRIPLTSGYRRPLLLNRAQELAVWQDIIQASPWDKMLMATTSLARSASQAYRLLSEWRVATTRLDGFTYDEAQALSAWIREFDRRCRTNHWLPEYRLVDELIALPEASALLPAQLYTCGFEDTTPQQQAMFDWMTEQGCALQVLLAERSNQNVSRVALVDREQELAYAASWAESCMRQSRGARVAIALTDFEKQLADVRRALNRVLYPRRLYPSAAQDRLYQTGDTARLAALPMIDAALRVLSQSRHRVDLFEFSAICRSAYIAGADEELTHRARLDAHLRSLGELTPSIAYITSQIFDKENDVYRFDCPQLYKRLHDWRRAINELPARQKASEWVSTFARLLDALGWPGRAGTELDAQDRLNRWNDVLSQLSVFDAVIPSMDINDALGWLRRLAGDANLPLPYQAAPIYIVSIDDAARLGFDYLWICGLDDEQWPPVSRPNPLIPLVLQREAGMSGASSSAVTNRAARLIDLATGYSAEVILSHACTDNDRELRPSPLVWDVPAMPVTSLTPPAPAVAERLYAARAIESLVEQPTPLPATRAFGGTSILKNQAACPFRAFVTHRLTAEVPEEPEPGLDASERGTLVHKVLEIVWSRFVSHSGLVATDEAEREHIVLEAARTALDRYSRKKPETLTPRFREIELERLVTQVMAWLHWEQQRESFTVLKPEAERLIELAGLKISMRIDRIDQNVVGDHIVLDYKTGESTVSSWFGERPDEPQLPLYALSETEAGRQVAAISFAQFRPGEFAFKGLAADDEQLPGVKSWSTHSQGKAYDSWQSLMQGWRGTLTELANDFVAGMAPVDPKASTTCRYCDLPGVCRVSELKQKLGLIEAEENGGD